MSTAAAAAAAAGYVAEGRLDAEVLSVTRRVGELLQKLPRDINPVNLEELRRIKQTLVELENKVRLLLCSTDITWPAMQVAEALKWYAYQACQFPCAAPDSDVALPAQLCCGRRQLPVVCAFNWAVGHSLLL